MEIIAELEPAPRGAYCGSLFILGGDNWLQSSIAIRTLEVSATLVHCWGGGGITASSEWEAEYQETLDKVGPIMAALEEANQCSGNSIPRRARSGLSAWRETALPAPASRPKCGASS